MAISSVLKANTPLTLLLWKGKARQNFEGNLHYIDTKSPDFWPSLKFTRIKCKNLINYSTSSVAFDLSSSSTSPKENQIHIPNLGILKALKWVMPSFLLMMIRREVALAAISVGSTGGLYFSSPSTVKVSGTIFYLLMRYSQVVRSKSRIGLLIAFHFFGRFLGQLMIIWLQTTVIKLQVGLLVSGPSLQKDLNRIAETTDASTSDGWRSLLKRTIDSLLLHDRYWISGYSSLKEIYDTRYAKKYFKKLVGREERRFVIETLVSSYDMEKGSISGQEASQFMNKYMVVTVLVAGYGMITGPEIPTSVDDRGDVEKVLKELQFVVKNGGIHGVKVFWTPQKESDIMSLGQLQTNYPGLRVFSSVKNIRAKQQGHPV